MQPDSWGISSDSYSWMTDNFFRDRANLAKALNKPIILEEYGMRAQGDHVVHPLPPCFALEPSTGKETLFLFKMKTISPNAYFSFYFIALQDICLLVSRCLIISMRLPTMPATLAPWSGRCPTTQLMTTIREPCTAVTMDKDTYLRMTGMVPKLY